MRSRALALMLALAVAAPVSAQGLMAEMHRDVREVQKKLVDLAKVMPESSLDWRPSPGVRSVRETLLHVAADNYLIPIMMGAPAPAESKITSDWATAATFEKQQLNREQIAAAVEASFVHLHKAMGLTTDANLTQEIDFFGQKWSRQRAMLMTVTHLHEHLGQMIAYARSNNVTPPWSK
ncbi:MAG: DinB family protein [Gemmatimonadaceae bacterium]|nr:DinB family protein [Gemmatimonadaceae bacterium]